MKIDMSAKNEKVISAPEQVTQTKVGYIPIYRTDDYGGRTLDKGNVYIYENKQDCEGSCSDDDNFVAVATVTWVDRNGE